MKVGGFELVLPLSSGPDGTAYLARVLATAGVFARRLAAYALA